MAERRPLVQGLKQTDREIERQFVSSGKVPTEPVMPPAPAMPIAQAAARPMPRMPLTSRLRGDLSEALKRASLERQLQHVEPSAVQDILDSALETWLRANGHLPQG